MDAAVVIAEAPGFSVPYFDVLVSLFRFDIFRTPIQKPSLPNAAFLVYRKPKFDIKIYKCRLEAVINAIMKL